MTIASNSFVFIDLYFALKNPFYERARRLKFYYTFLVTLAIILSVMYISLYAKNNDLLNKGYTQFSIAMGSLTFIPVLLIMCRLQIKGTS